MSPPPPPPPPTTDPPGGGPRANPFRDAGPFGSVEIGGVEVPGILQSIGGLTAKQEWNFQKAGGGSGAAANSAAPDTQPAGGKAAPTPASKTVENVEPTRNTGANIQVQKGQPATTAAGASGGTGTAGSFGVSVWRGALLAEEIEIVCLCVNERHYDDALDFMFVLMPKRGKKPPSLTLVNPSANAVGITRCAVREVAPPMETAPGSGKWEFKFKICEYNPQKTAAAGKADPAKPPAEPTPKDARERELQELLDKARN